MYLDPEVVIKIKSDLSQPNILVVGDVMLDQYWFSEVSRISPEAPVPIAKVNKTESRPGGAANVARNIANLGGQVSLLSVVGNDKDANDLEKLLSIDKVKTIFKHDAKINTIVKLRLFAKNQQLIRIDFEEKPSHEILAEILDKYTTIIDEYDLIILSDYGKGGLSHTTQMIEIAKKHNKILLLDPKGKEYSKYKGATLITPNKMELADVVGMWESEEELEQKAVQLKQKLNIDNLLLTRSEEGMTLFTNTKIQTYPTVAREVYDVSGAGDTVIATVGLMLANKMAMNQAVLVANIAAGIVVGKVGTATVSKSELLHELSNFNSTN